MVGGLVAWKAAGFATEIQIAPHSEPEAPVFLCPPPGEVLRKEYLEPLGIAPADLAARIGVLEGTIKDVLSGNRPIGVELSLRLARYFSTASDFWVHLQVEHDLERTRHSVGDQIRRDIQPRTSLG
ncbi:addiction module antidote protein, HigA family [Tropicimonas sp. IMCC6043]|nr:addiction module antidote protein, HigA family [Tropicimonas sp. IMCC6043]